MSKLQGFFVLRRAKQFESIYLGVSLGNKLLRDRRLEIYCRIPSLMHPTICRLYWMYFTVEFYFITGNAFAPNTDKSA